jgi:hypothetical protein
MAKPRRQQVLNASAVTVSGNSGPLSNLGRMLNPVVVMLIDVTAVSGTTPSLTFTLNAVLPDGSLAAIPPTVAIVAITATGQARYIFHDVIDPTIQLNWAVTGTTPSLTCNVDLFFTSPDA